VSRLADAVLGPNKKAKDRMIPAEIHFFFMQLPPY
jgi:hypothetical protein